jgi:hypothetical protein
MLPSLAVLLVIASGGCSDPAGLSDADVGAYTLRTINGAGLPANLRAEGDEPVSITAGALILRADRTFARSLSGRALGVVAITTHTSVGTYAVTRSGLRLFFDECECHANAMYVNGTVTIMGEDNVMVYTR